MVYVLTYEDTYLRTSARGGSLNIFPDRAYKILFSEGFVAYRWTRDLYGGTGKDPKWFEKLMLAHDLSKVSGHASNWDFPFVSPLFLLVIYKGNTGLNLCPGTLERSCVNINFSNHFGSFPAPPYRSLVYLYAIKPSENKILMLGSQKRINTPPLALVLKYVSSYVRTYTTF